MSTASGSITPPGRLGNPDLLLRDEPRADPRMVAALAPFGLDVRPDDPPVSVDSPIEDILAWAAEMEAGFQAVFEATVAAAPAIEGVTSESRQIPGPDGNEIALTID